METSAMLNLLRLALHTSYISRQVCESLVAVEIMSTLRKISRMISGGSVVIDSGISQGLASQQVNSDCER
jgi:hypothetical protein